MHLSPVYLNFVSCLYEFYWPFECGWPFKEAASGQPLFYTMLVPICCVEVLKVLQALPVQQPVEHAGWKTTVELPAVPAFLYFLTTDHFVTNQQCMHDVFAPYVCPHMQCAYIHMYISCTYDSNYKNATVMGGGGGGGGFTCGRKGVQWKGYMHIPPFSLPL